MSDEPVPEEDEGENGNEPDAPVKERPLGVRLAVFPWEPGFHAAGLQRDALYLVRPDGHVAMLAGTPVSRRRHPGYHGSTRRHLPDKRGPMTTYISDQDARKLADLDERTRQAWTAYNESLRDLQGRDYEEAEDESWGRLQKRLKQLDDERALVEGA